MVSIAFGSTVAQAGRTSAASLLALGLVLQDRRVELVQVLTNGAEPLWSGFFSPPFDYTTINIDEQDDWEQKLAERVGAARAAGRDVVIDLPAISLRGKTTLLSALNMVLVPLRPGVLERHGAVTFWEDVIRTLMEVPAKHGKVSVRLMPVGWSDSAMAVSEVIRLRGSLADAHKYFLPPPEIVPWNIPLILPQALEGLGDGGKLPRTTVLDPIARKMAEVLGCWGEGLEDTFVGALPLLELATSRDRSAERRHRAQRLCQLPSQKSTSSKKG